MPEVEKQHEPSSTSVPATSRAKLWLFRFVAIVIGLAPLVAFEGLCVLLDWGRPGLHDDPFVGFHGTQPLFVLNDDNTQYEIPKSRQTYFRPQAFPAAKPKNTYRVFCVGESTTQGSPFAVETAYSTWLRLGLAAAEPKRTWEVINCGGISYASYRLAPIVEEVLAYQPDLVVLFSGHNEFLEDRTLDHIERRGPLVNAALTVASRSRGFTLAREGYLRLRGISSDEPPAGRPLLPTEVDALLDYRGGLAEYHQDEQRRSAIVEHYRFNLARMIARCRQAGVRVVLINPVSNLADCPPFKAERGVGLSAESLAEWESLCEQARERLHAKPPDAAGAARLFAEACRVDPAHAGGYYNWGKCLLATHDDAAARKAFVLAKEHDVCPLRMLESMGDVVRELSAQTGTPLVDAQQLFDQRSPHGISGDRWLVDHVHPSIEGHQVLADALLDALIADGVARPTGDWKPARREAYRAHLATLGPGYYFDANQRLENLRAWSQGRGERLRVPATEAEPATSAAAK